MTPITDFTVREAAGAMTGLGRWRGQVLLIVNTASKCGFTPQYQGLEALHRRYGARGFEVLAFPCNQFGGQEPGDAAEIADFCSLTYDVSFPVFAKIEVNGSDADPLFERLKADAPGLMGTKAIKWNFTKFLVDRDGKVVRRYAPTTKPEAIEADIQALLRPSSTVFSVGRDDGSGAWRRQRITACPRFVPGPRGTTNKPIRKPHGHRRPRSHRSRGIGASRPGVDRRPFRR